MSKRRFLKSLLCIIMVIVAVITTNISSAFAMDNTMGISLYTENSSADESVETTEEWNPERSENGSDYTVPEEALLSDLENDKETSGEEKKLDDDESKTITESYDSDQELSNTESYIDSSEADTNENVHDTYPDDMSVAEETIPIEIIPEETIGAAPCPLPEGLFFISDEGHKSMLAVSGNVSKEHANIQLGRYIGSNARIFKVKHTSTGQCTIQSLHTGLYLALDGTGNVEQSRNATAWTVTSSGSFWTMRESNNRWLFADEAFAGANVRTADTGTKWDFIPTKKKIAGAMVKITCPEYVERKNGEVPEPDISIELYGTTLKQGIDYTAAFKDNGSTGMLTVTGIGEYTGFFQKEIHIYTYLIPEGTYRFSIAGNPKKQLAIRGNVSDDNANVLMYNAADSNVRIFEIKKDDYGCYTIRNYHTGGYILPVGTSDFANVVQRRKTSSPLFLWSIEKQGASYVIRNKGAGTYLYSRTGMTNVVANKDKCLWNIEATKPYIRGAMVTYSYASKASFIYSEHEFEEPAVKITLYGNTLENGVDYSTEYTTDVEKMKGTIILRGKGAYQGKTTLSYDLNGGIYERMMTNTNTDISYAGKTYIIHPADDMNKSLALSNANASNGIGIMQAVTGEKFYASYMGNGFYKLVCHNINFSLYGGPAGRSPLRINQTNVDDIRYQWVIVRNADGTCSIRNKKSSFAITKHGDGFILYPFCDMDEQKFVLEETDTAWSNRQNLNYKLDTYNSEGEYIWTFIPSTKDTIICLTKESSYTTKGCCSGIRLDMKNGTMSILKGFNKFAENLPALKSVSLSSKGINLKAGLQYTLTMKKYDINGIEAKLYDVSARKGVSIHTDYDTGRGWGTIRTRIVSGSLKTSNMRAYTAGEGQTLGIIGDSYTEAASLGSNYKKGYLFLTENGLGEKIASSARGGAKSGEGLAWLRNYYLDAYHPQFLLIEFGMNDSDYNTWLSNIKEMIALAEAHGITPILMTVPPSLNKNDSLAQIKTLAHRKMSKWVMESGYAYVDFECLMTYNGDRITPNLTAYLNDGTHPTTKIHDLVSKQLLSIVK